MKYQIISDGSCDLPPEMAKERGIHVVPFYVSFDDTHYYKENVEIHIRDFYQSMVERKGVYPKSSLPSIQDYCDVFERYARENLPMICICITEKFSGSFGAATNARELTLEKYPNARITVINSQINTVLQGIYVLEACRLRDQGFSYEECIERLLAIRSSGRIFFTVGDLEYLRHGGRIGKLAGLTGSLLGVKPLITLKEGEIFPSGIARSRKRSMQKVIDLLQQYLSERFPDTADCQLCIGYGYSREEAEEFRALTLEHLPNLTEQDLPLFQIGATIGVHTGPYPIGFGVLQKAC